MANHHYIGTIAGFDPSSGAGLTSDIKTFDAHGLYGLSVCTAVTVQNDIDFKSVQWISSDMILSQIETLLERFALKAVKIGIVENWETLSNITQKLRQQLPNISIVLDPVLKASAGFDFHEGEPQPLFDKTLESIDLITPNYSEIQALHPEKTVQETVAYMSSKTNVYLKGGHRHDKKGWDELFTKDGQFFSFPPQLGQLSEKHGSGCVLSAAIAGNLSIGMNLEAACKEAKYYTEQFLKSSPTLLGTHIQKQLF